MLGETCREPVAAIMAQGQVSGVAMSIAGAAAGPNARQAASADETSACANETGSGGDTQRGTSRSTRRRMVVASAAVREPHRHVHTPTTRHTMGPLRGTRLPSGRARTREPHTSPDPPPLAEPRYEA